MGSITERKRQNGTSAFLAQISINRDGKIAHREAQTFERRTAAAAWIKKREKELTDNPAMLGKDNARAPILADTIDRYVAASKKALGRTKRQVLSSIKQYDIASMVCDEITSADIVTFAEQVSVGRTPQTVSSYLSHLSGVFAIARPAWGINLAPQAMKDAFTVCKNLGITGKGRPRERRPTLDELDLLLEYFASRFRSHPDSIPMHMIVPFAIFATRRQEEICRIVRPDLDAGGSRIMVRDMKNPGEKIGNDVWCDLPAPALRLLHAMPKTAPEFFPYNHRSVSARFTRACHVLGIADLHFHDLRHEGISRLFEIGTTIPHAAAVSGHRSWASLQTYTHVRQTGDKYENWKWLDILAPLPQDLRP